MSKIPSFQFYPADWLNNIPLQSCSLAARGLLINMMCVMHQSEKYGYFLIRDKKPTPKQSQLCLKCDTKSFSRCIKELLETKCIRIDDNGVYYCRRMIEDEKLREIRRVAGGKGGNPKLGINYNKPGFIYLIKRKNGLVKIGISGNPVKRLYKIKQDVGDAKLISKSWVDDMGLVEAQLHNAFSEYQKEGEWFNLPIHLQDIDILLKGNVKGNPKLKQTPSSSSSSSASQKENSKRKISLKAIRKTIRENHPDEWASYSKVIRPILKEVLPNSFASFIDDISPKSITPDKAILWCDPDYVMWIKDNYKDTIEDVFKQQDGINDDFVVELTGEVDSKKENNHD